MIAKIIATVTLSFLGFIIGSFLEVVLGNIENGQVNPVAKWLTYLTFATIIAAIWLA